MAPLMQKTPVPRRFSRTRVAILVALLPPVVGAANSVGAHEPSPSSSKCTSDDPAPIQGEFAPQGLDTRTFSKTVQPGDDFFNYVNEGWINSTQIPAGHWDYGQTTVLISKVEEQIRSVVASSVAKPSPPQSVSQQVGDAYASFLDVDRIEQVGSKALETELKSILTSKTPSDVARWMANPTSSSIVAINVFPAEGRWLVHLDQQNLSQPTLGLWGRESYERMDGSYPSTRAAYQAHIARVFELAGIDDATGRAARVVALEAKIASNQWTLEKLRDRKANYHPLSVQELTRYAPGFPWRAFLEARCVGLQAPYFDANADPAVNFGAIGGIIGHEMGHAFDDQGIIYDSQGRLRNWWSAESLQQFRARTQALVEQADSVAINVSFSRGHKRGATRRPRVLSVGCSTAATTRRRHTGSTASSETWTIGTKHLVSRRLTSCMCRRRSASGFGEARDTRPLAPVRALFALFVERPQTFAQVCFLELPQP